MGGERVPRKGPFTEGPSSAGDGGGGDTALHFRPQQWRVIKHGVTVHCSSDGKHRHRLSVEHQHFLSSTGVGEYSLHIRLEGRLEERWKC